MKIELYDTTLRDGTQGEGICLTMRDKLRITEILDELGIPLIEGGWPGSNPKDAEYFRDVQSLRLTNARIAAFGSTRRPSVKAEKDPNLRALLDSETPVTTIFGKAWTRHVEAVLRTTRDNNLRMIEESVALLKNAGRDVIFDAEHFFDGYAEDPEYAVAALRAAEAGGASSIVLCDTNGGTMPWQVQAAVEHIKRELTAPVGIHAHNDGGCGVANSITAIRAGAVHVQGTMNGIGERCGNADLCAIMANLQLKMGMTVLTDEHLARLTEASRAISEMCNIAPNSGAPYVGRSAFAHKAGVHVAALQRDSGSYEHISPDLVGNATRVLVSELSGRGNLRNKASQFGLVGDVGEAGETVLEQIKELENRGFSFESAEASVELMMRRAQPAYRPFMELVDFLVVVEHREQRGHLAEANVKIRVDDHLLHTAASGDGPVEALDAALRKALIDAYPAIESIRLVDYKVRILDSDAATSALTRVLIASSDGDGTWSTVGASRNIIEASWQALSDSMEFGLMRAYGMERPPVVLARSA